MINPTDIEQADNASANGQLPKMLAAAAASTALVVPYAMSRSTTPTPGHPRVLVWYRTLSMPDFKPPDIAIPIVWTGIETALGYAGYRLLRTRASSARNAALAWLGVNVVAI